MLWFRRFCAGRVLLEPFGKKLVAKPIMKHACRQDHVFFANQQPVNFNRPGALLQPQESGQIHARAGHGGLQSWEATEIMSFLFNQIRDQQHVLRYSILQNWGELAFWPCVAKALSVKDWIALSRQKLGEHCPRIC